jgi:hypothetical protein
MNGPKLYRELYVYICSNVYFVIFYYLKVQVEFQRKYILKSIRAYLLFYSTLFQKVF